jgi:hypothetical protein
MTKKKTHEPDDFLPEELVEHVEQERPPGKFDIQVENYEAGADVSSKPGPTIETGASKAKGDNEFDVDLSHLTPSARERTLAEMREGRTRVGKNEHDPKKTA